MKKTQEEKEYIGTIELGNFVYITDPCYEAGIWCQGEVDNMAEGKYNCYATYYTDPILSARVSKIFLIHESIPEDAKIRFLHYTSIIGVDSGQAGFFDEKYFENNQPKKEWYKRVCNITLNDDVGTIDDKGFVASSGFGDGMYELFANTKRKKVYALKLVFI